ncbi:unnamed protein product [Heterobilharzia americana]|nr:unnamed protein product [Heterobilharzia americana]
MIIIVVISQYLLCTNTEENMFNSFKVDMPRQKESVDYFKLLNKITESQSNSTQTNEIIGRKTNKSSEFQWDYLHTIKMVRKRRTPKYHRNDFQSLSLSVMGTDRSVYRTQNFYSITFKQADCYLHSQTMHLYEMFHLQFSFKTSQEHGLLLFNSGKQGVDFLAFELIKGYLHFVFDMGSGAQRNALVKYTVTDLKWHCVELLRMDLDNNILQLYMDRNTIFEQSLNISVIHGDSARNFNLNDPLYIGGTPQPVFLKWREKISSFHGFQGCFGNFSINGQNNIDLLNITKSRYFNNWTIPVCYDQILDECLERPKGALQCNNFQGTEKHQSTKELETIYAINSHEFQPYCLNDGICLQTWNTIKCACELTSFEGDRCTTAGTTFLYDFYFDSTSLSEGDQISTEDVKEKGYLQFIYMDSSRNTKQDEFVLGVQTLPTKIYGKLKGHTSQLYSNYISTLIFVSGFTQIGDFIHLFLESGIVRLNYNMGGGVVHISGPNFPIDDGFYHRIRGYRVDHQVILEVDDTRHTYELNSAYGKQFNNQKVIWLGHAPELNRTDFFRGYMTGVYYNGLLLNDLAAGLLYLPYIHVTRFANVKYVPKFQPNLGKLNFFKDSSFSTWQIHDTSGSDNYSNDSGLHYVNRDEPITINRITTDIPKDPLLFSSNFNSSYLSQLSDHLYLKNGILTQSISPNHNRSHLANLQFNDWKAGKAILSVHKQVNIWLLICLAGACLVMIISLTFLAYKCHHNKNVYSHSTEIVELKPNTEQIHLSHSSLNKKVHSIGSLLGIDDIQYNTLSTYSKQHNEPSSCLMTYSSHLNNNQISICEKESPILNTIATSFILVTEPINLTTTAKAELNNYNLERYSIPVNHAFHVDICRNTSQDSIQFNTDKYANITQYNTSFNQLFELNDTEKVEYSKQNVIYNIVSGLNTEPITTIPSVETNQIVQFSDVNHCIQ